jgi:hypothetical protein
MPDELRMTKMAQWEGTRIKFRGTLAQWAPWYQPHGREYRKACLNDEEAERVSLNQRRSYEVSQPRSGG